MYDEVLDGSVPIEFESDDERAACISFFNAAYRAEESGVRRAHETYARAEDLETIVLTYLMFETIGATMYRLALGHVKQPRLRHILTILARDESFHVPLNVPFISISVEAAARAIVRQDVVV